MITMLVKIEIQGDWAIQDAFGTMGIGNKVVWANAKDLDLPDPVGRDNKMLPASKYKRNIPVRIGGELPDLAQDAVLKGAWALRPGVVSVDKIEWEEER